MFVSLNIRTVAECFTETLQNLLYWTFYTTCMCESWPVIFRNFIELYLMYLVACP